MKKFFPILVFLFVFVSRFSFAKESESEFPSLDPLFSFTSENQALTGAEVIRLALSFSVSDENALGEYEEKYLALEKKLLSKSFGELSEREKGAEILSFMYDEVLSRYSENQTRLDRLFDDGTYNCVSSSVLYAAFASAASLAAVPQKTPDHAFITLVFSDGSRVDVETTNPYGFEPGTKKTVSQTDSGTRYAVIPKKKYSGRKSVSQRMLVSLVGGNLSVMSMESNNYALAVPLQATRLFLVQDCDESEVREVWHDFDTVCSNYASLLQRQKRYLDSVLWFEKVQSAWGNTSYIQERYETACHNYVTSLLNDEEFLLAEGFIDQRRGKLSQKTVDTFEKNIFMLSLQRSIQNTDSDSALNALRAAAESPLATGDKKNLSQIGSWQAYFWAQKVNDAEKHGGFAEALSLVNMAIEEVPGSKELEKLRSNILYNHAVDVHNEFASLANKGRYEEALAVLERGLSEDPTNKILSSDRERLRKQLGW